MSLYEYSSQRFRNNHIYILLSTLDATKPQVDSLQDTMLLSSSRTIPHRQLDQLRIALRHPLPPAGTIKHAVDDLEEESIYHK